MPALPKIRKSTLISLLSVLVVSLSVVTGVILIQRRQELRTRAQLTPSSIAGEPFVFTAAGDHGAPGQSDTKSTLEEIINSGAAFHLALGDMSYSDSGSEPTDAVTPSPWCSGTDPGKNIKLTVGDTFPFQLIVGNHEDDDYVDGFIDNFAVCLPDRMSSSGRYGAEYYFDYPKDAPLMRVIAIGAGNDVNGERYSYNVGNSHYNWLANTIDSARAAGIPWVVVGMHKVCITMGNKPCEIGEDLMDLLISKKVDLVLQGHDHDYQRSKMLKCADSSVYRPECVVDDGSDNLYPKGGGTVFVITGTFGGGGFTSLDCSDSERFYFSRGMGGNGQIWTGTSCQSAGVGRGLVKYTVTPDRLDAEMVVTAQTSSGTKFVDTFTIATAGPTNTPTPTPLTTATLTPTLTPTTSPTPIGQCQPREPYYANFFYIWYQNPNTDGKWGYWTDLGNNPPSTWFAHYLPDPNPTVFDPANELYSANNYEIFKWQVSKMAEAKQEVAIASWWGPGTREDLALDNIINSFMPRFDNPYPNLRWSIYYEDEGFADPSVSTLVNDLTYIKNNFTQSPYFFKIDGRPVIFVFADAADTSGMTKRWKDANAQMGNFFYIVLKVFPGYASDSNQPDSWHQYAPAIRSEQHSSHSFFVSPGFWLDDGSSERLVRNASEFETAVKSMVSANTKWKLTQTWNEWGEGTSVEPGEQVKTVNGKDEPDPGGYPFKNLYVDILNRNLPEPECSTGQTPTPPPSCPLAKEGDINCDGIINILDFQLLNNAFGTSDPDADLNADGTVNILDFQILSNNFGSSV